MADQGSTYGAKFILFTEGYKQAAPTEHAVSRICRTKQEDDDLVFDGIQVTGK